MSTALSSLAGSLRVAPGAPLPLALQSSRQDWAPRLARGQAVSALPGLMASLFNLCSHAHRLCSQLAIEAAAPGLLPAPQQVAQRLRTETAQEHIRRIGLDWPRLLAAEPGATATAWADAAHAALQRCPLLLPVATLPADPWPATLTWLQDELLQMPPHTWQRAWNACGADWQNDWSRRHSGWLPSLLRAARESDLPNTLAHADALHAHADGSDQRTLSAALALQHGFALHPLWHGACAHTGSWTRQNGMDVELPLSPWALLGSRIAELIRLCQPDAPGQSGAGWLSFGSLRTGPRQGMAWVEMARGLLVHQVEIDQPAGDAPARVAACRVLAPTEWNFHPQGVVAQTIAGLNATEPVTTVERRVRLLMAAFDPCVPFDVTHTLRTGQEVQHA
ncbi:MAG: hydrogenase formation protein [Betaproteobacteria bacterium HGW-Betaproteobacteria-15]|nr:MAG: hydrogenase formation protein [Betaproteobacteria bacterium HGW-Betaproteobacteria-15]